jgi:hypothetical protein
MMAEKKSFECECGVLIGVNDAKERDQKYYTCQCCGRIFLRWTGKEVRPLGRPIPIKTTEQVR